VFEKVRCFISTLEVVIVPIGSIFHLDTLPGGQAIKPDLFFMEAIKPQQPNYRNQDKNPQSHLFSLEKV
jgi:hypothetical protein